MISKLRSQKQKGTLLLCSEQDYFKSAVWLLDDLPTLKPQKKGETHVSPFWP